MKFVDPMLRRRLGPLARALLHVANDCAGQRRGVRIVLASQHGELSYAVQMLRQLAAAEPVSPALFSLTVHNAPAGVFSIARADRSPSTAVAAGEETLCQGLLEAHGQLEEDGEPVLFLYGDAPLPAEYRPYAERPDPSRALAMLLERGAQRAVSLDCRDAEGALSAEPQADAFFRHLEQGAPGRWTGAARTWSWQ
ncbi:MAG TPA: beta-ketoacyl synthase chain length factor [Steroidobacteraceae bacterium]|nr:beta-ketoacyl synthase chain length factor [Steroidobacteraceae bacterium]